MKKAFPVLLLAPVSLLLAQPVQAQSGHFIHNGGQAVECFDVGTQVRCAGKVAGLGGTTFEITIVAVGIAEVECANPAGNVAPGQDTEVSVDGGTGPLPTPRNGQYRFDITTDPPPSLPPTPTCPNPMWTANIIDVAFTTATLTLKEDGAVSDQVTVSVQD
jgi:hypothetical protein